MHQVDLEQTFREKEEKNKLRIWKKLYFYSLTLRVNNHKLGRYILQLWLLLIVQ